MNKNKVAQIICAAALSTSLFGCAAATPANSVNESTSTQATQSVTTSSATQEATTSSASSSSASSQQSSSSSSASSTSAVTTNAQAQGKMTQGGMGGQNPIDYQPGQTTDKGYTANDNGIKISETLSVADAFTERDLAQTADTANAQQLELASNKDITITEEGVYVVSGTATESTIVVEAADTAKVQIVLDGASITNTDFPAIYVKSADKVFVTLVGENNLSVTGEFVADGETNTDAVIYSKDDICLNGSGSLSISSSNNAIKSNDDLKITGGTYTINAAGNGLSANDSIRIANGTFTISAEDGIKAENDEDNELGYVYIQNGTFNITTNDNGIQGCAFVWIDGGTFDISSAECIEGTYVQINDGTLHIAASDDGINASIKSSVYTPTLDITGGTLTIEMAQGDTDALDSNGYLYISGGKIDITGSSAFDYAWGGEMTGGEVTVNGQQVTELTESMMGGGMMGGGMMGGQRPDGTNGEMSSDMMGRQRPGRDGGMMPDGSMQPPSGEMPGAAPEASGTQTGTVA